LTGNQGRPFGSGPAVVFDHVLIPVLDLERAATEFGQRFGLDIQPGGSHPGVGTGNQLVALGSTYLEVIAVLDEVEAQTSARSQRVLEAARLRRPFAAWAAHTGSIDRLRERLAAEGWSLPPPQAGARIRPDGVLLEWRTQELAQLREPSVLPFVIEWNVPAGAHPAQAPSHHPSQAGNIVRMRFTAPDPAAAAGKLATLLGDGDLYDVDAGEREELVAIELEAPTGRIKIP
jgi:hypothetical protein